MGDLERAVASYESALRHNAYSVQALSHIAAICRSKEEFKKAAEYFGRVVGIAPESGDVWGALGTCFILCRMAGSSPVSEETCLGNGTSVHRAARAIPRWDWVIPPGGAMRTCRRGANANCDMLPRMRRPLLPHDGRPQEGVQLIPAGAVLHVEPAGASCLSARSSLSRARTELYSLR